jgi:hypothetical protein
MAGSLGGWWVVQAASDVGGVAADGGDLEDVRGHQVGAPAEAGTGLAGAGVVDDVGEVVLGAVGGDGEVLALDAGGDDGLVGDDLEGLVGGGLGVLEGGGEVEGGGLAGGADGADSGSDALGGPEGPVALAALGGLGGFRLRHVSSIASSCCNVKMQLGITFGGSLHCVDAT